VCVKWSGVLEGHRKIGKPGWSTSVHKQRDRKECTEYKESLYLASIAKYMPSALKMPWSNRFKAGGYLVRFSPWPQLCRPLFTRQQIFKKSWEYVKYIYACFANIEKAYDRVPRKKLWRVLRLHGVNDRLFLGVKSLHFCSEFCVRIGRIKSQPWVLESNMGCAVTARFHNLYEMDRQSQPSRRGGHRWTMQNQPFVFFAGDLARQCTLQVGGYTLQQVETFKYLGWNSRVTEDKTKRLVHVLVKQTLFCVSFIAL